MKLNDNCSFNADKVTLCSSESSAELHHLSKRL